MVIKLFFSFLFILTHFELNAQKYFLHSSRRNINEWENKILQQEKIGRDTLSLKIFLEPLLHTGLKSDLVLYNLLLGNGYASYFDGINRKSDLYFSKALINSRKLNQKSLEIWATLIYAEYFYNYRKMTHALPFFISAIEKINQTDPSAIIFPAASFTKIGFYMGTIGDNVEAINYLNKALKYTGEISRESAKICDNLGLYYLKVGDLKNARKFIEKGSKVAKLTGDQVRYAKTLGNLALICELDRDFKTAIKLVLEDVAISEKYKSEQNTMYAYTLLSRLYIANNEIQKARESIKKAGAIAKSKSYFKINELEILKLKLELMYKEGKGEDELGIRRRIGVLEDSLNKTEGILPRNQANWMMQKRKYQQNIEVTKEKLSQESLFKNLIVAVGGILILFVLFIVFNSKKQEKKKELQNAKKIKEYEAAKMKSEQKLLEARRSFDSQFDFLKEKNIQIQNLYLEIENIKKSKFSSPEQDRGKLNDLLKSHLMTEDNWIHFRGEFQNKYPDFYDNVQKGFPEITDSNLRIILLQKLGFSNTEISGLLGITVDAVKKSKQRLKRKLGEKYDQLFEMIFSKN